MNKLLIRLKRIMISCVILTFLFNYINSYDEPLSIEPMYANFNYWDEENQMSCNYNRRIEDFYYLRNFNEAKDTATITINYSNFNTDALQRFINIVLYYRNEWLVTGGNRKETPTKYILLNPQNSKPESIITFPYGYEDSFTIEII